MKVVRFRGIRGLNDVVEQHRQLKRVVSDLAEDISNEDFSKIIVYTKGSYYLDIFKEQARKSCVSRFVWEMVIYDYLEKIKRGDYYGAERFA